MTVQAHRNHRTVIVNGNDPKMLPDIEYEHPTNNVEIIGGEVITDLHYPPVGENDDE